MVMEYGLVNDNGRFEFMLRGELYIFLDIFKLEKDYIFFKLWSLVVFEYEIVELG